MHSPRIGALILLPSALSLQQSLCLLALDCLISYYLAVRIESRLGSNLYKTRSIPIPAVAGGEKDVVT